jgi:hypothetical protein
MPKRDTYEDGLQRAVAQYLDLQGWLWCHVANERKTSARQGAALKRQGVKAGVPDVLIFELWREDRGPGQAEFEQRGSGVAIELKSPKGRLTTHQVTWINRLRRRGWYADVCRTLPEVIELCGRIIR